MEFEEWWNRYSYDWRPDIAAEHKPTAEHAYTAGVQAEREKCAVKDAQIKILWGALETIIDITHCTCTQYRQDPAILCPTCTAISAIDSMERIGSLPDSALPQR